jgi:cysteinyl-tRNA synthetase
VYFDVEKYNSDFIKKGMPYGILSGRVLDDQLDSTRELDNQEEKRNKSDFALWKNAPPEHIMRWQSPWGHGFPGWHIECSAMSNKYLGEEFDIHGGGMDLQFPHHECEIAQSAVCNDKTMARYWLHNNMITINGRKMGKSYNNVIKLSEMFSGNHPLLKQAYTPMTIRFFILQSHYRSTLDFGNDALEAAEKGLKRLWDAYEAFQKMRVEEINFKDENVDIELEGKVLELLEGFEDFMNDDFNTAKVLANMFEVVPVINSIKDKHIAADALTRKTFTLLQQKLKYFIEDIFGLQSEKQGDYSKLDGVLQVLIELRKQAKEKKDYVTSDAIRLELLQLGIALKDEKDGNISYSFA